MLEPKRDYAINGGALQMALNVLRRCGKTEVAEELEKSMLPNHVLGASLADAQAEIARLRGALEEINRTTFDDDANRIAHGALQK